MGKQVFSSSFQQCRRLEASVHPKQSGFISAFWSRRKLVNAYNFCFSLSLRWITGYDGRAADSRLFYKWFSIFTLLLLRSQERPQARSMHSLTNQSLNNAKRKKKEEKRWDSTNQWKTTTQDKVKFGKIIILFLVQS